MDLRARLKKFFRTSTKNQEKNGVTTMPDLSRKIKPYAIKFKVTISDQIEATNTVYDGFIWLTFNLESTFYDCDTLRKTLDLFEASDAFSRAIPITAIKINNTSELCRMGALGQINVILRAKEPSRTYSKIGAEHKTSFFYNLDKSIRAVAAELKTIEIKVGPDKVIYQVEPSSISEKKSKKSTPHF